MEHTIALVTGATSRLGHAAVRLPAAEGSREVIDNGYSRLARVHEAAAQLAVETKRQAFTPLELVKRGRPVDFLLLNAGTVPGKRRMLTVARAEAAQATLTDHHQLTVGLLHSPSNSQPKKEKK